VTYVPARNTIFLSFALAWKVEQLTEVFAEQRAEFLDGSTAMPLHVFEDLLAGRLHVEICARHTKILSRMARIPQ